ncbi:rhodanese-like domain-containing protein [Rossellomorea aquimaris]|uniref:rhodanese-like domain-containing protein n=1 Tax=Rossellomorea aquimaris TaxID=189382 RepID=UPI001CD7EB69|nr:rhodanese-like domain-containing protein [Rossellomorea aquimaris]MCA1053901.1 rhodanese-like domain-containing protein [Rossellomorea aquimaris]
MNAITPSGLQKLLEAGENPSIIDVRETSEVKAGKIPNALNIPLGLLEFRMNELNKTDRYYIVCQSGGRSSQAVRFLQYHGFNVVNMEGGMSAWKGQLQ